MNRVLFQIGLLTLVAGLFGALFVNLKINFFIGFVFGILVQYGIYHAFAYGLEVYTLIKAKRIENERLKELSLQGMVVTCPCNRKINEFVPIRVGAPNHYKCNECQKTVSVFLNAETAIITEPINNTDIGAIENIINQKINELT